MYIIITYDVKENRVSKVCNFLRQYLDWVQNSVFEGTLTISELLEVLEGLKNIINIEEDSIRIYTVKSERNLKKMHIGKRYEEPDIIL